MTYLALEELTLDHVNQARGKEVSVKNHRNEVYLVRLHATHPGYVVRSAQSQAVVYVLTLREVTNFCRNADRDLWVNP